MKLEWIDECGNNNSWIAEGVGKRLYSIFNDGTQWLAYIDNMEFEYDRTVEELKELCQEFEDLKSGK